MRTLILFGIFCGAAYGQSTPAAAHPWYVKPEHGQWMICVKSYTDSGEERNARTFAEALAQDIRERYKVPAYLFERGSIEKQRERERHAQELARQRAARAAEAAAFEQIQAQARAEAAAKGMQFLESKPNIKAPTVRIEEQWAVLIGGWPDMASARREMEKLKTWEPPANKKLMDAQFIVREGKGEMAYVNPFQAAMVVPNPMAPRTTDAENDAETRFVMKLNEDEEYSVLRIQKKWTIVVKNVVPPHEIKGKQEQSFMGRLLNPKPNAMVAAGEQARNFCIALRNLKPSIEAYVLHTRYGSLVCVGQFDGPDDPKLLETQEKLGALRFNVQVQDGKKLNLADEQNVRRFDHLYAMQVRQ